MNLYGLIGYPLTHSFSPEYFKSKFAREKIDADYQAFPIETISEITTVINQNPNLKGLNVTIPYKQSVIEYLHELDAGAAGIQAVNTIAIDTDGKDWFLKGYNTDIYGFETTILDLLETKSIQKALILGTGATSKTVKYALSGLNISCFQATRGKTERNEKIYNYREITGDLVGNSQLIVNTTPVGMYPEIHNRPDIPYEYITKEHILYDLIYNPSMTLFLEEGKKRGALVKNGYEMLVLQAEKSWEIWQSHL